MPLLGVLLKLEYCSLFIPLPRHIITYAKYQCNIPSKIILLSFYTDCQQPAEKYCYSFVFTKENKCSIMNPRQNELPRKGDGMCNELQEQIINIVKSMSNITLLWVILDFVKNLDN